jgi:hypothetical protein
MKRALIALFIALVLFCATGGLDRFAPDAESQEPAAAQETESKIEL